MPKPTSTRAPFQGETRLCDRMCDLHRKAQQTKPVEGVVSIAAFRCKSYTWRQTSCIFQRQDIIFRGLCQAGGSAFAHGALTGTGNQAPGTRGGFDGDVFAWGFPILRGRRYKDEGGIPSNAQRKSRRLTFSEASSFSCRRSGRHAREPDIRRSICFPEESILR